MSEQTNEAAISYEESTTRHEARVIYPNVWVCHIEQTEQGPEEKCGWEVTGRIEEVRTCTIDDDGKETCTEWRQV